MRSTHCSREARNTQHALLSSIVHHLSSIVHIGARTRHMPPPMIVPPPSDPRSGTIVEGHARKRLQLPAFVFRPLSLVAERSEAYRPSSEALTATTNSTHSTVIKEHHDSRDPHLGWGPAGLLSGIWRAGTDNHTLPC